MAKRVTTSLFRSFGRLEESMIRAAMPATSLADQVRSTGYYAGEPVPAAAVPQRQPATRTFTYRPSAN